MKNLVCAICALGLLLLAGGDAYSDGKKKDDKETLLHARLHGFQEVPVVSTVATGELRARINPGDTSIDYELSYSGLQGNVTQAHIHLGQRGVNGGIVLWFCGTTITTPTTPGPAGTPTCSPGSGTFAGTFTSANVLAIGAQQISAGELAAVIAGLRAGVGYANVHTTLSTGGEIRGQIRVVHHDKKKDDDKKKND